MHRTEKTGRKCLMLMIAVLLLTAGAGRRAYAASNEQIVYQYLVKNLGMTSAAACGVMGNIWCESNFVADITGMGSAYGLCQWADSRKTNLFSWCISKGYDYRTASAQMAFLGYELKTSFSSVLAYMRKVPNTAEGARTAGAYWCYYFEKPSNTAAEASRRGSIAASSYWPKFGHTYMIAEAVTVTDGIKITWDSSGSYYGFIVQRADSIGGSYSTIAQINNGSTRVYYDKKAEVGQSYSYCIIPLVNSSGQKGTKSTIASCIREASLADSVCEISLRINEYTYNGKSKRPAATVVYAGETLNKGTDYTVSYENNKNAGTAAAIVTGTGGYVGSARVEFKIKKAPQEILIEDQVFAYSDKTYRLEAQAEGGGEVTFGVTNSEIASVNGNKLRTKDCGNTLLVVRADATDNYKAAKVKVKLTVQPARAKITGLTETKDDSLRVEWKALDKVGGYEVQYSSGKRFGAERNSVLLSGKKTTSAILECDGESVIYVRVRGYRTKQGRKIYGKWSIVKKYSFS